MNNKNVLRSKEFHCNFNFIVTKRLNNNSYILLPQKIGYFVYRTAQTTDVSKYGTTITDIFN